MRLYGKYKAKAPCLIDFIEFEFSSIPSKFVPEDLKEDDLACSGVILSVDWDESDWAYDEEAQEGSFRAKGVYINQMYANGHANVFKNAIMDTVQVVGDESANFELTELAFEDISDIVAITGDMLKPRFIEYVE